LGYHVGLRLRYVYVFVIYVCFTFCPTRTRLVYAFTRTAGYVTVTLHHTFTLPRLITLHGLRLVTRYGLRLHTVGYVCGSRLFTHLRVRYVVRFIRCVGLFTRTHTFTVTRLHRLPHRIHTYGCGSLIATIRLPRLRYTVRLHVRSGWLLFYVTRLRLRLRSCWLRLLYYPVGWLRSRLLVARLRFCPFYHARSRLRFVCRTAVTVVTRVYHGFGWLHVWFTLVTVRTLHVPHVGLRLPAHCVFTGYLRFTRVYVLRLPHVTVTFAVTLFYHVALRYTFGYRCVYYVYTVTFTLLHLRVLRLRVCVCTVTVAVYALRLRFTRLRLRTFTVGLVGWLHVYTRCWFTRVCGYTFVLRYGYVYVWFVALRSFITVGYGWLHVWLRLRLVYTRLRYVCYYR